MQPNLNQLKEIFVAMGSDGFDVNSELQWGFYFIDSNRSNLLDVYEELKDSNYVLEGLEQTDDNLWQLHVSKIEILSVDKLHRRNIAFNELADGCDVECYDGWDVGKLAT